MANMSEIKAALNILTSKKIDKSKITILHCNTEYPTPFEDVNLNAMKTIESELNVKVGYSDHTLGITVPIAAVAMGARVIEKHFTIDTNFEGPDHKASLSPNELKKMIKSIRELELAMSGSGKKEPSKSELKNIEIARKSIYYTKDLDIGDTISEDNILPLRPAKGISPMNWKKIVGRKVKRKCYSNSKFSFEDIY